VDIMRLKEQGLSKRAIAKRLGISRDTVSKYWNTANLELRQRLLQRQGPIDRPLQRLYHKPLRKLS